MLQKILVTSTVSRLFRRTIEGGCYSDLTHGKGKFFVLFARKDEFKKNIVQLFSGQCDFFFMKAKQNPDSTQNVTDHTLLDLL